jgi:hypothetical protein
LELYDADNTRQVSKAYTISSADTWEYKTVTFPADTTGAFGDDNAHSLSLQWGLGAGSNFTSGTLSQTWTSVTNANRFVGQVNVMANTAYDVYITGVQLELGEVATPFEHISYGDNLAKCQRYYELLSAVASTSSQTGPVATGQNYANRKSIGPYFYKTEKRAAPTIANVTIGIDAGDTTHAFAFSTGTCSTSGTSTTATDIGEADTVIGDWTIVVDADL